MHWANEEGLLVLRQKRFVMSSRTKFHDCLDCGKVESVLIKVFTKRPAVIMMMMKFHELEILFVTRMADAFSLWLMLVTSMVEIFPIMANTFSDA